MLNERRTQTFNDLSDLRLKAKITSNIPQKSSNSKLRRLGQPIQIIFIPFDNRQGDDLRHVVAVQRLDGLDDGGEMPAAGFQNKKDLLRPVELAFPMEN